jgi:hypothetical protein
MTQTFTKSRRSLTDRSKKRMGVLWIALAMMIVALTPRVWGQDNATITGTVADSSGAVVANATVDLTNTATGQVRESKSNTVGEYRVANIGIGTYTLTAVASGFETFTRTGIIVNVAQTLEENIALSVGSASQTVTVQANALQVQTETSEVSTLISGQQVQQLSTNGRNIVQLAALGMGVANNLSSFGGINALTVGKRNQLQRQPERTHNVYLLDGTEQNDRGCGGCYMVLPSQDCDRRVPDARQQLQPRLRQSAPAARSLMVHQVGDPGTSTVRCTSSTGTRPTTPRTTSTSRRAEPGPEFDAE